MAAALQKAGLARSRVHAFITVFSETLTATSYTSRGTDPKGRNVVELNGIEPMTS